MRKGRDSRFPYSFRPLVLTPYLFPLFQGCGQIYNGQHKKRTGFFLFLAVNFMLLSGNFHEIDWVASTEYLAIAMLIVGYVLSIIDTNLSAKKINQYIMKLRGKHKLKRELLESLLGIDKNASLI